MEIGKLRVQQKSSWKEKRRSRLIPREMEMMERPEL
jgi:hypothetical protein